MQLKNFKELFGGKKNEKTINTIININTNGTNIYSR